MGTSYTRQDVGNNIANKNVINAEDLDREFDQLEGAFNASTGHTHDGTTGEGGPIIVVGPSQEYVATALTFYPKTNNFYDLGSLTYQWKDGHFAGEVKADSTVVTSVEADTGSISSLISTEASVEELTVETSLSALGAFYLGEVEVTASASDLNKLVGFTGDTTTLNYLKSLQNTGVTSVEFDKLDGLTATTVELNKLDGFTGDVGTLNYLKALQDTGVTSTEFNKLDGLTATTAELNKIDGFTGDVTTLNYLKSLQDTGVTSTEFSYLDGTTSNLQTQINSQSSDLATETDRIDNLEGLVGNLKKWIAVSGTITLTVDDVGAIVQNTGAGGDVYLPPQDEAPRGSVFWVVNAGNGDVTLRSASGTDDMIGDIYGNDSDNFVFKKGDSGLLIKMGAVWRIVLGSILSREIGVKQDYEDLTSDRDYNVSYFNDTGRPIGVSVSTTNNSSSVTVFTFETSSDEVTWKVVNTSSTGNYSNHAFTGMFIVPNNRYYRVTKTGPNTTSPVSWSELML